uniref:Uncharacterized protein n=1 Tax=Arundo donax TaxID=35708 RepID=A0A0A9EXY8_ARUDO
MRGQVREKLRRRW